MKPDFCPHCGTQIPAQAPACPGCGSCEETGWSEEAKAQSLGLPDEQFDYQDYVQREFGAKGPGSRSTKRPWWILATAMVLLGILAWAFFPR